LFPENPFQRSQPRRVYQRLIISSWTLTSETPETFLQVHAETVFDIMLPRNVSAKKKKYKEDKHHYSKWKLRRRMLCWKNEDLVQNLKEKIIFFLRLQPGCISITMHFPD